MTKPPRTKFDDKSGGNVTKDGDKPTLHERAEEWDKSDTYPNDLSAAIRAEKERV